MRGRYERNPGRTVELNVGGSQDVLDLQWRDEIAHVICVTLIGPPAISAGQVNAAACVALVQWGAGEAEAEAEIDFGVGGVIFTLPASSIRITAEYEANLSASESQVRDTNVAEEVVKLTKSQILQQAGTAVLAQANSAPQQVLALLK